METEGATALPHQGQSRRYDAGFDAGHGSHALVLDMVPDGASVLDLGCAGGSLARALQARGCRVVGVESDVAGAARAAEHLARTVVCDMDGADLGELLAGERFDVVVAADVLEHLRDPAQTLRQVAPLLREGGCVIASIPNVAHGSVRLALLGGTFDYADWGLLDRTHLRFYTASGVEELMASAGLVPVQVARVVVPVDSPTAVPFDAAALPPGAREWVEAQPDATTYQFVVRAVPDRTGGDAAVDTADVVRTEDPLQAVLTYQAHVITELQELVAHLRESLAHEESRCRHRDELIDELLLTRAVRAAGALRRVEAALRPSRARPTVADTIRSRRDGNV